MPASSSVVVVLRIFITMMVNQSYYYNYNNYSLIQKEEGLVLQQPSGDEIRILGIWGVREAVCEADTCTPSLEGCSLLCIPGTFLSMESRGCTPCLPGTYQSGYGGLGGCDTCEAGLYASGIGSTVCDACEMGKYTDNMGCVSCGISTEHVRQMDSECRIMACEGGYIPTWDMGACVPCPEGWSVADDGLTCVAPRCPDGLVRAGDGVTCVPCPLGWVADGQVCSACAAGTGGCIDCMPGTYASASGASACRSFSFFIFGNGG